MVSGVEVFGMQTSLPQWLMAKVFNIKTSTVTVTDPAATVKDNWTRKHLEQTMVCLAPMTKALDMHVTPTSTCTKDADVQSQITTGSTSNRIPHPVAGSLQLFMFQRSLYFFLVRGRMSIFVSSVLLVLNLSLLSFLASTQKTVCLWLLTSALR